MAINANAIAPLRPAQPLFDSLYVRSNGELIAGATGTGMYRSVDDGLHWAPIPEIAAHPDLPDLGDRARLGPVRQQCKPHDFGASWTCIGMAGSVNAVDGNGTLYKCSGGGIEASRDGGKTFAQTGPWPESAGDRGSCRLITAHETKLYAFGQSLHKSSDGGAHWTPVARTVPGAALIPGERLVGLLADKRGVLYATTAGEEHLHVYSSADGGVTWQRQTFGLPTNWRVFTLQRVLPDAVYFAAAERRVPGQEATLYRSVDGKTAHQPLNLSIKYGSWVDVQTGLDGSIYVVTQEVIHKSGDAGKTWRQIGRDGMQW